MARIGVLAIAALCEEYLDLSVKRHHLYSEDGKRVRR